MPWPIMGSTALFLMAIGGVFVMNGKPRRLGVDRRRLQSCCCT